MNTIHASALPPDAPYRKTLSLQGRLALLIALLLLPLLVLAFYFAKTVRDREHAHVKSEARALARAVAIHQGASISEVRKSLAAIAAQDDEALWNDCETYLGNAVGSQSLVYQMALATSSGQVLCGSQPLSREARVEDRRYFKRAVSDRQFVLSQAVTARNDRKLTVIAAQPVLTDAAKVKGVLLAAIDLKWTQDVLAQLHLPRNSTISVADVDGTIVARMPEPEKFVGKRITEATQFSEEVRENSEGYIEAVGLDGVLRTVFHTQVPGSPLYLRVGIPRAEVDAAGQRALAAALTVIALVLGSSLLLGWAGARRLVLRPIRRLTEAAERLGAGNWRARTGLPHADDAIGRLALKLDELAEHGQRVTRAFRTLSAGNRTLLRAHDELTLLKEMCQVAVEKGGYLLAYVSYAGRDAAKSIVPMEFFGENEGFVENIDMTWEESERGMAVTATAIREGTHSIIRDIASDERTRPWHDEARKRGFGAVIALPLKVGGEVIGAFTLIAREGGSFSDDEVALLDEMAADLSFGIQAVRGRAQRRKAERAAKFALSHDPLTGLPNRAAFLRAAENAVMAGQGTGEPVAVLIIHLPRLQEIVDGFGYQPGQGVLREVKQRLARVGPATASLARTQINEFAVCLPGCDGRMAVRMADMLLGAFEEPVKVGEAQIDVAANVGVSCFPGHGEDVEVLLRRAAIAAREGVRRDRSYTMYHGATDRENPERLALAAELRGAITKRELVLYYQPKIDIASCTLHSAEALVRWPHETRGMISPAQFVPLAEETGLIRPMTANLVEIAVRQQHTWMRGGGAVPLAVNLSVRNLYDPQFLESLEVLLETWGVPASLLEFEITEGALVDDPDTARRVLSRLRELGSKTYIDDFGTGYSSLNYLVSLPVHALKIDQSFVKGMNRSPEAHSVVASIISMAHNLGLEVVAEGVETEEDLSTLSNMGCDKAQGYYLGRPVPASEFEERFLRNAADVGGK